MKIKNNVLIYVDNDDLINGELKLGSDIHEIADNTISNLPNLTKLSFCQIRKFGNNNFINCINLIDFNKFTSKCFNGKTLLIEGTYKHPKENFERHLCFVFTKFTFVEREIKRYFVIEDSRCCAISEISSNDAEKIFNLMNNK